jgi:hypothetical protein
MPADEVLLIKDLFVTLITSSYKCFTKDEKLSSSADDNERAGKVLPESYSVTT